MKARHSIAERIAHRLLRPSVLDEGLRSGLFLGVANDDEDAVASLLRELASAARCLGALVVVLDLAESVATPEEALRARVSALLAEEAMAIPARPSTRSRHSTKATLAELSAELVVECRRDLVLIIGHIGCLLDQRGADLLMALKAARDAVNLRAGAKHHVLVVGVDADPVALTALAEDNAQAFYGATVEL